MQAEHLQGLQHPSLRGTVCTRAGHCLAVRMRILRLLSNRLLPCGCRVGIYETYIGPIVRIVDARAADCSDFTHRPGTRLDTAGRPEVMQAGRSAA